MSIRQGHKQIDTGEIPEEWEIRKLGDKRVARQLKAGGTPLRSRKEYYENGTIPFVRIEDITTSGKYLSKTELKITEKGLNNSSTWLVPEKSILYSMYASYGETVISKVPVATNQAIIAIIPSENVDLEYLYYSLKHIQKSLYKYLRETTQKNLNAEIVKNLKVPLPPFVEQQKIATILSCVDEAIQKTDEVIAKIERLKKGLMQQLLTKGIGHKKFKYSKDLGFEIPKEWAVVKYRKANERIFVGIASSSTKHFCKEGIPLIRNQNIKEKGLDLSDLVFITRGFSEANKSKMLRENDIVTVRTGYPGLSCKVTKEMEGWHTFTTLISRPNLAEFDPDYLVYILNSPVCKAQISRLQAGMAQQNLNVGQIVNLMILKPPKSEQKTIAERLKVIDRLLRVEEAYLGKLRLMKQGLMHDLLSGRIRVKVD
jgi:type I restriction enzyme S subunit